MTRSDLPVLALGAIAVLLLAGSAAFLVWSVLHGTTFRVLNADLPGFLFAAVGIWFGIRYLRSVIRLYGRVRGRTFRWSNFKGGAK